MSIVGVKINLYFTYKWFYGTMNKRWEIVDSNKNDATFYCYERKKKNNQQNNNKTQ